MPDREENRGGRRDPHVHDIVPRRQERRLGESRDPCAARSRVASDDHRPGIEEGGVRARNRSTTSA